MRSINEQKEMVYQFGRPSMPLMTGLVLEFPKGTAEVQMSEVNGIRYLYIEDKNGVRISLFNLFRRGNGINLKGDSIANCLEVFLSVNKHQDIIIRVVDMKNVNRGDRFQRIPILECDLFK